MQDDYEDRQSYVNPQRSRVRGSALKIVDESRNNKNTNENAPSQAVRSQSNRDKLRENLRQRPTISTTPVPTKITSTTVSQATRRAATTTVRSEKEQKRSRYSPITR